ncbi:hypothetical protein [Pseudomonas luteola]|uniref:hypothetical protein n=1 Tax=Pseudomonas luteola TaxID=47886 RepID=UPI0015E35B4E|nr:hypothetical protein [Pseudomonas zeshuii]MBA1250923.1 hypothetical protein [Pseudomonas zeshuii]
MNGLTLAMSYLVVVLHQFWRGDELVAVGSLLEVDRRLRNDLVGGQVARDATPAEIAEFRGEPPPAEEGQGDDGSANAALAAAKTQLAEMGKAHDTLQAQVEDLTAANKALTDEVEKLKAKKTPKGAE